MRAQSILLCLLPLAISSDLPIPVLKGELPVYLGDVFYPPAMTFLAWIPSVDNDSQEWCSRAADASNDAKFSLGGMDGLKIHDYFQEKAYVSWDGSRFLDCVITPDSVRLEFCQGVSNRNEEGGWRYLGPGFKKWSCWVVTDDGRGGGSEDVNWSGQGDLDDVTVRGSEEILTDPAPRSTGEALSNSIIGAFTAAVTSM